MTAVRVMTHRLRTASSNGLWPSVSEVSDLCATAVPSGCKDEKWRATHNTYVLSKISRKLDEGEQHFSLWSSTCHHTSLCGLGFKWPLMSLIKEKTRILAEKETYDPPASQHQLELLGGEAWMLFSDWVHVYCCCCLFRQRNLNLGMAQSYVHLKNLKCSRQNNSTKQEIKDTKKGWNNQYTRLHWLITALKVILEGSSIFNYVYNDVFYIFYVL